MGRSPKLQTFQDESGQWRWRLKAANGRKASTSGESFTRESDAKRAARKACALMVEIWDNMPSGGESEIPVETVAA